MNEFISVRDNDHSVIQLHCRFSGNGSAGILFLHGLAGSGETFDSAGATFDEEKWQLLIPDLPGHGDSPGDHSYPCSPAWYRDVLISLLDSTSLHPSVVVGHSMGGTIGLLLCESLNPSPFFINVEGLPKTLGFLKRRLERYGSVDDRAEAYETMLSEFRQSSDPELQAWCSWASQTDPYVFFKSAAESIRLWEEQDMMERYRRYPEEKRHYVCGEHSQANYIRDVLDETEYTVIPDAGHFPMVGHPEAFWKTLRELPWT